MTRRNRRKWINAVWEALKDAHPHTPELIFYLLWHGDLIDEGK